mmetsp:Transcript_2226/g.5319  ORF Transcript_2226/g.5319 Transcript_2226/m.5319 type:complete len:544 (+) Transcript_2226:84-1715(+)
MARRHSLALLLCALSAGWWRCSESASAKVSYGELSGNALASVDEFVGVPFAKPPVGNRRFAAPVDWSEHYGPSVYNATEFGARCPQPKWDESTVAQDESCLFLNIWSPRNAGGGSALLPVLVFIYGGSFIAGAGDMYNGTEFAQRAGVVVVNLNYRLGALGFAVLGGLSGNFGLLDQQSALRWLSRELHAFGGDASKVLLFGESAGSISASAHLLLPGSAGLFQAALMESGVVSTTPEQLSRDCGAQLAALVNCSGPKTVECARAAHWKDVLAAQTELLTPPRNGTEFDVKCSFWTSVDGATIPEDAEALMRRGAFYPVPVVVGVNHDEGGAFAYQDYKDPMDLQTLMTNIRTLLNARGQQEHPGNLDSILKAYLIEDDGADLRPIWGQLVGDFLFACKSRRFLRMHQGHPRAPKAFKYVFAQRAAQDPSPTAWGVYHSSELPFVWGVNESGSMSMIPSLTPSEGKLRDAMQSLWGRFAAGGDLNIGESSSGSVSWPKYDAHSDLHLELKVQSFLSKSGFRQVQCDAWDKVWNGHLDFTPTLV